jgi:hypothetical protein
MLDVGVPGFLCLVFKRHDFQEWLVVSLWFVKRVDLTRRTAQRFVRFALLLWATTLNLTQFGETS